MLFKLLFKGRQPFAQTDSYPGAQHIRDIKDINGIAVVELGAGGLLLSFLVTPGGGGSVSWGL